MENMIQQIKAARVIAILRGDYQGIIQELAEALLENDIRLVEVTMNSPGVLTLIETLVREFGEDMIVGAGTVMNTGHVKQVADAGARFVVAPDTNPDVIEAAFSAGLEPMPGALTPTEISAATRAGARLVKLFPASFGGPGYLKQILAPLDSTEMIPTGGITAENASAYLKAGAVAVGVGGALVPKSFEDKSTALASLRTKAKALMGSISEI